MANKPSIPKGTRDFGPVQMRRRNYIFNTIKSVFELHGFDPIETPAMELSQTLLGKYGEEGDRLIFRIMPRGRDLDKVANATTGMEVAKTAKEALRYDLTVPFARFVVQHQNELSFPFKRYQIQPVWRADRPQSGRYREFYQCDVDIIGSDSLMNEIELIQITDAIYDRLGLPGIEIKLNNRKILMGIAEVIGESEKLIDLTVALDKLDKLPQEKVLEELTEKGFDAVALEKVKPLLSLPSENNARVDTMKKFLATSEVGLKGIEELEYVMTQSNTLGIHNIQFEVTLARGLNYYTGAIFEVTHPDFRSSITGGGRYDDLTGIFGLKNVSGVGISFGADRIYDLLEQKELYPEELASATDALIVQFDDSLCADYLKLATRLRKEGISVEIYPDAAKMKKQMKFANDKGIANVIMMGSDEVASKQVTVKNMVTGEQTTVSETELISYLKK
jgi:histidyl-tRNA synthetase